MQVPEYHTWKLAIQHVPLHIRKKKYSKRKTRDSSSSLLFFHLIELHPSTCLWQSAVRPLAAARQLWRRIRWSEFGGKTWKTLGHTKKHGKNIWKKKKHTHLFRDSKKHLEKIWKNDHDKFCPNFCWVWKLRHSNSTSTSDTEAAQILATPWGLSKTKKDHLLKNRGPKCGRFIGQLWPT